MRTLPKFLSFIFGSAILCFAAAVRGQTYQYQLEPGSTITPSYYGNPTGPSQPLTGTFSWTFVSFDAYWTTYNFSTTALNFHSTSMSLTLNSRPYNGGTSSSETAAGFEATVNATGGGMTSPLSFVPWPANDGSYEGDPSRPTRLIFLHERLDPAPGALISFTAVLVPEPSAAAFMVLGLISIAGWNRNRRAV
jgi:hypothetical protein